MNLRDKMSNDITIQRKRALMALEKLAVHFTGELEADQPAAQDVQALGQALDADLAALADQAKAQAGVLETSLAQLDTYQQVFTLIDSYTNA